MEPRLVALPIRHGRVTRGNKCTRSHYANTSESRAFAKPIRMFYGTISCQSTVPHVNSAENLLEHPEPSCAAHVCTLEASDTASGINLSGGITLSKSRVLRAVFVVVLFGDVVLGDFAGADFALVRTGGVFHAAHDSCLERLTFFQQFVRALGIGVFHHGRSAKVTAARSGSGPPRTRLQRHRLDALVTENEHSRSLASGPGASRRPARRFACTFSLRSSLLGCYLRLHSNLLPSALGFLLLRFFRHVGRLHRPHSLSPGWE